METKSSAAIVQALREDDLTLILEGLDALTEKIQDRDEVVGNPDAMATLERIFDLRSRLVDLIPALGVAMAGLMPEALREARLVAGLAEPEEETYPKAA